MNGPMLLDGVADSLRKSNEPAVSESPVISMINDSPAPKRSSASSEPVRSKSNCMSNPKAPAAANAFIPVLIVGSRKLPVFVGWPKLRLVGSNAGSRLNIAAPMNSGAIRLFRSISMVTDPGVPPSSNVAVSHGFSPLGG